MTSFSPARPWRLLHPPALGLPRQSLCPGTRFPERRSQSPVSLPVIELSWQLGVGG